MTTLERGDWPRFSLAIFFMENINHLLFLWLNAPEQPAAPILLLAIFLAEWMIWAIPLYLGIGWRFGDKTLRKSLLMASASGVVALVISQLVGALWPHPRPFMIGLGHQFVAHVPDASFPSDHLTLWWAVAFSVWGQRGTRSLGTVMALVGLAIAWARIYVGVHFPLDMVGAIAVAWGSAWLSLIAAPLYLPTTYKLAVSIHRRLFGFLIRQGWLHG